MKKKQSWIMKLTNVSNNIIMNYCMDTQKLLQQWKFSKKIIFFKIKYYVINYIAKCMQY